MLDFCIYNPTRILFGRNSLSYLPEMLRKYNARKILLLYDEVAVEKSCMKDKLMDALRDADIPYVAMTGVRPNPRISLVYKYIELCRNEGVNFVLAVGGGSTLDSGKAIAAGVLHKGDIWPCFTEGETWSGALPVGVILTLPASGSETSGGAVLLDEQTHTKRYISGEDIRPKFAILNPEFTMLLPAWQTACGIVDIISHLMERYFTIAEHIDDDINDRFLESAICIMLQTGPKVLKKPYDYELRAQIMWAGTVAEHGVLNAGILCDWPAHDIAHEISGFYDVAHGATLSIVLPAWMKYIWRIRPARFAHFSERVMSVERGSKSEEQMVFEGIERLESFFRFIGMPVRFSEANIPIDRLDELAQSALRGRKELGSFAHLIYPDVYNILSLAR